MKIARSGERTTEILDKVRNNFMQNEREGLHLSDLLYPRRSYWQKVMPLPPTNDDIQYWLAGRGHEDAMHRITGIGHSDPKVWNEIIYTYDFYYDRLIEMKTRRGNLAKTGEELHSYSHYLKQLLGYCAVEGREVGELWIWSLLERKGQGTAPEYVAYIVNFTHQELEDERSRLLKTRDDFRFALEHKNHSALPLCPEWMCYKKVQVEPPRCLTCKKKFVTNKGAIRHTDSKIGKGHSVLKATMTLAPACRWQTPCFKKEVENGKEE